MHEYSDNYDWIQFVDWGIVPESDMVKCNCKRSVPNTAHVI